MTPETPTAPATPAISQIRSASPGLAELGSELMCLHKAATPGPWIANLAEPNMTGNAPADARVEATGELTGVVCNQLWNHDAAFIAFARTALPTLLSIADMLEQRQQWQPIETLNKSEMQFVLVYEDEAQRVLLWNPDGCWEHPYPFGAKADFTPTHWMPLPTPPALRSIAQMEEGI